MATSFLGEIKLVPYTFSPAGFAFCDGRLVSISQNTALFSLIGTTYGGDGVNTFALPDLRGRVPLHQGTGGDGNPYVIGQVGGIETVTLSTAQLPSHQHTAACNSGSSNSSNTPARGVWLNWAEDQYTSTAPGATMTALPNAGGSQPHDNMLPFQAINYVIALNGIFPSRN